MALLVVDSSVHIIQRCQNILSEIENSKTVYGVVSYKVAANLFKEIKHDVMLLYGGLPGTMSIDL
jgi:two-component SAPR family response regulator